MFQMGFRHRGMFPRPYNVYRRPRYYYPSSSIIGSQISSIDQSIINSGIQNDVSQIAQVNNLSPYRTSNGATPLLEQNDIQMSADALIAAGRLAAI